MLFLVNPIYKEIFQFAEMFYTQEAPPQQSQVGLYVNPGIRPTALNAHISELGIRYSKFRVSTYHSSSYARIVEFIAPASI